MPDVIGVSLTHFEGERRRQPEFALTADGTDVRLADESPSPPARCRSG